MYTFNTCGDCDRDIENDQTDAEWKQNKLNEPCVVYQDFNHVTDAVRAWAESWMQDDPGLYLDQTSEYKALIVRDGAVEVEIKIIPVVFGNPSK